MSVFKIKQKDGTWTEVATFGSFAAADRAELAAIKAENLVNQLPDNLTETINSLKDSPSYSLEELSWTNYEGPQGQIECFTEPFTIPKGVYIRAIKGDKTISISVDNAPVASFNTIGSYYAFTDETDNVVIWIADVEDIDANQYIAANYGIGITQVANDVSQLSSEKADKLLTETEITNLKNNKVDILSNIAWHNTYPRCKYLGDAITTAQNEAIKNRTYEDLFIGDYWTIGGINYRIAGIEYYTRCGDTDYNKGHIIVVPDTCLYSAKMNDSNITTGAYTGSKMRTSYLTQAYNIARSAFGNHVSAHRILLANAVDSSSVSGWAWIDSNGVELMSEVQVYGTRVWGSALKGFDVGTQKQQFPLFAVAPQFVNIRESYWLQDVSSASVSSDFAYVDTNDSADTHSVSDSLGVRPAFTLSFI